MVRTHNKVCEQYFEILRPLIRSISAGELVVEYHDSRLGMKGGHNANGVFNMLIA